MRPSPAMLLCALALGCGEGGEPPPEVDAGRPLAQVATQNAGNTPALDLLARSPRRPTCEAWYANNLCTLDMEAALRDAVERDAPDVLMLQEVFDQAGCAATDRPAEANAEPFVCAAGEGHQLERVLPPRLRYACAAGYPDNCIAWDPAVFTPEGDCAVRDCSSLVRDNAAPCGRDGRLAWLAGHTIDGPLVLVVVHTNAGIDGDCRAAQIQAMHETLRGLGDAAILMAGDFNFDPSGGVGADAEALEAMMADLGLQRLPDDGDTHRVLPVDLDLVLYRGLPALDGATCRVAFADAEASPPMFDHALVSCGN